MHRRVSEAVGQRGRRTTKQPPGPTAVGCVFRPSQHPHLLGSGRGPQGRRTGDPTKKVIWSGRED